MPKSVEDAKAIRLPAAAIGLLAGFGIAYLANFFVDIAASPPLFYWGLIILLLPFIALGMIVVFLWVQKPLSLNDAQVFVLYFFGPFFSLYVTTSILYWVVRM